MKAERAQNYEFAQEAGNLASMNAAKDDGATLQTGEVGEIASVEIGATGQGEFSEYERISLGGVPDPHYKTKKARISGDLQNSTPGDVAAGTKVRLRITDKRRSNTFAETRWFGRDELEASNIENQPVLEWEGWDDAVFGKEGRVIVLEARNARNTFDISVSDSNLEFPFIGGY